MRHGGLWRLRVGGLVLAVASATLAVVPAPARGDGAVSLQNLPGFADITVDSSHVFITSALTSTSILVTDYAGATVANIGSQNGADGMALSADGSTLYVALSGADAISVIDTATLTETTRYATGASTCPHTVALAGNKVWFSYGCTDGTSHFGSIDPATDPATVTTGISNGFWYYPPILVTSPGNPNLLVAGERGESPSHATIYDVSSGSLVQVATSQVGGNLGDIAISADGTKMYVSDGAVHGVQVFSTSDFSSLPSYPTGGTNPLAVALSADGTSLAGGRIGSPDVYLYKVGGSTAYRALPLGNRVARGGLAFAPDGSALFAITVDASLTLHVISGPEKTPSSISLTSPATASRGANLTISGSLSLFEGPITSAQTLTVTKQDLAGMHALPQVTTSASGAFSFGDAPPVGGPNTYTVSWAGDTDHLPTSAHTTVNVSRQATSISVATSRSTVDYQHAVAVTAHLGTTYNARIVTIYAQPKGLAKKAIKTGGVDGHGNLRIVAHPARDTTFTAAFAGDYRHAPAAAARRVIARASLAAKLTGWYKKSHGYYVYHHTVNPTFVAHIKPTDKAGEKLCFPLQLLYNGKWQTHIRRCFPVDRDGSSEVIITKSTPGYPYRFRAEFAGDSANAAIRSRWYYYRLTN